ncbi:type I polyketide synthase [Actinomadura verrucosospora]|uniref:6-deoxyerythronolide-B synthase, Aspartate racemase n=1 Tax=Actinomadura verrucosospora TaxID=46165 RepID=A0A7D3VRT6_ACTVE|nr:type I polyketide synthase [Actinomadura verrucosospora]QKG18656.1 6-deoxyerythronolide-B synthase, Aspartate racemase [Actinomadura verrucosospora]
MTAGFDLAAGFEPVAVVGLAGRFPGAADVSEFWANIASGTDCITRLSDDELIAAGVGRASLRDPSYVKAAPVIAGGAEGFDAELFQMTPRDATVCDPQLRLFLETSHAALENAGYDPWAVPGAVGVFGATSPCRYVDTNVLADPAYSLDMGVDVLTNADYLATFTSYKLGLRGPSMTVLSACSSSLVAVHTACQSLASGESDVALAGGANIMYPYRTGYRWVPGGVQSPDGRCRPFDAAAAGTVFGDGAGVVVLKRLRDALVAGDSVRAVIRGTAVNNDGADKLSFSAPSLVGQSGAVFEAMSVAGLGPADIDYVEAHGTGTPLGDPIEVAALAEAYRLLGGEAAAESIALGSVKSNIGHLVAAAGIAGLIKTVLALEHERIPATAHFREPNPALDLDATPFRIADRTREWPARPALVGAAATAGPPPAAEPVGPPRRAGVSSLGVGGTNAHVVVEAAPAPVPIATPARPRIVVWSALAPEAERSARGRLAGHFAALAGDVASGGARPASADTGRFADAVATLQRGRTAHPVRGAVVSADAAHAAHALDSGAVVTGNAGDRRPLVFAFPGQGAAKARMAAGLYGTQRVFTEELDACLDSFEKHGSRLYDAWLDPDGDERVQETLRAQPLLFSVEYALARTWLAWGIEPGAVVGHSLGEVAAATVAGVFDLDDAVAFVAARAAAMQRAPRGAMVALRASEDEVRAVLPPDLVVAAVNAPDEVVVAGTDEAVRAFGTGGFPGRTLRTSHAFHSPAMDGAVSEVRQALDGVRLRPPALPLWSAATGGLLGADEATDPDFWAGQIRTPVRFADAAAALLADGPLTLLEVGPGQTLGRLIQRARPGLDLSVLASLPRSEPEAAEEAHLLGVLARLWTTGHDVGWDEMEPDRPLRRVAVPGYPYQRVRHWVDAPGTEPPPGRAAVTAPEGGTPEDTAAAEPAAAPSADRTPSPVAAVTERTWRDAPRSARPAGTVPRLRTLALLPADPSTAVSVVAALHSSGHDVIRVRPGSAFAVHGGPAGAEYADYNEYAEYTVRPGSPDDMARVVGDMAARGVRAEVLVHAWATMPWPPLTSANAGAAGDLGLHGLRVLLQEGLRGAGEASVRRLVLLTSGAVNVSGADEVDAAKAALAGAVPSLAAELPQLDCRLVDLAGRAAFDELADELRVPGPVVVALRGSRRWVPAAIPWRAFDDEARHGEAAGLRGRGVYLVTGGLGGLGIQVALGLARTGLRPCLALLGRGLPSGEAESAIREMTALGASVQVVRCDVADPAAVRTALAEVTRAAGPVNGVFHLAGVPGGGVLQRRDRDQVDAVLRPKVTGTLVLFEALADAALDFFVSFSSQAAISGSVGNADYGAANAALDALTAFHTPGPRGRRLSVNWPAWAWTGMAADLLASGVDVDGTQGGALGRPTRPPAAEAPKPDDGPAPGPVVTVESAAAAETSWALDEHRIDGVPIMPGTGHLDLVVRTYRERLLGTVRAPVVLEDVVFAQPMTAERPRTIVLTLVPAGAGAHRFTLGSRPADDDAAPLVQHAAGGIAPWDGAFDRRPADELRAGFQERVPGANRPSNGGPRGLMFGPRWMSIREKWVRRGEVLAELALPAPFLGDTAHHDLHPALLDLATGMAAHFGTDDLHLPFHYRRLTVPGKLPPAVLAHVRGRQEPSGVVADIEVLAPDGSVVAKAEGFRMRRAEPGAATARASHVPALADEREAVPAPDAGRAPATSVPRRAADDVPEAGIAPRDGVAILLRLLADRTPPQLAVRPQLAGRPVPLPPGMAAPEAPDPASTTPASTAWSEEAPAPPRSEPAPAAAEPAAVPATGADDGAAPSEQTLRDRLADIWRLTLGRSEISPDDDFFALGGDSLSAIQLIGRLRDLFGVTIGVGTVFDHPTLAALAVEIGREME